MTGERIPRIDKIDMLCTYLNCSRVDIMEEFTGVQKAINMVKIPVLGYISAGIPSEMIEDILDYEEIDANMLNGGEEYFALKIKGNSMSPRIEDGDVVIVRKQSVAETGDTVIVAVNGEEGTCKRIKKYRDGIEIIPTNPSYKTRFFTNEDIENVPVVILGKVVELRAKF